MTHFIHKFAAIDIGTNAVRLLFYNIYSNANNQPVFKKVALTRVPIRLGEDVFTNKNISEAKTNALLTTLQAFKKLIEVHHVVQFKACATSAMREAENGKKVIKKLQEKAGIAIEIINGYQEADLIYNAHAAESLSANKAYLYIDVGGGSTELTLFHNGKKYFSESYRIGTVRLIHNVVKAEEWEKLKRDCKKIGQQYKQLAGIGMGGNIIKLMKLAGEKNPIKQEILQEIAKEIATYTYEDRIRVLDLKPDRADVIIPAADIFLFIARHTSIKNIYVPKLGLADGIIHKMYENWLEKSLKNPDKNTDL